MQFLHELIVPEPGFPFKLFIFEGRDGNYRRDRHWHRSVDLAFERGRLPDREFQ